MFTQSELVFLIIVVCLYSVVITWMFMKKMKLFGTFMIFLELGLFYILNVELSYYSKQNERINTIEQIVTIESFHVLKNGIKIPIDTIVENIKIPITQINY